MKKDTKRSKYQCKLFHYIFNVIPDQDNIYKSTNIVILGRFGLNIWENPSLAAVLAAILIEKWQKRSKYQSNVFHFIFIVFTDQDYIVSWENMVILWWFGMEIREHPILAAILAAILNNSNCSRMTKWHSSDLESAPSNYPESTIKRCMYSTSTYFQIPQD